MKHLLLVTTVLATAAVAAAMADAAASKITGACYSKNSTIRGKAVIVACGPASANVHYKGKTYPFKGGTCFRTGQEVHLDLGTSLVAGTQTNGGFTHFSLDLLPTATHIAQVTADEGKIHLVGSGTYSKVAVIGTFKGTAGIPGLNAVPFTGSWNCGGAIYKF